jgi:DNA-binding helix-hairpin-helix protein with protein kinase domain
MATPDRYLHSPGSSPRQLVLADRAFASGAQGEVYDVTSEPGIVVKLYKDTRTFAEYDRKIGAMLTMRPNLTPVSLNGKTYIQIAWPIGKVTDHRGQFRGFAMPKIELDQSTALENILQRTSRQRLKLPENYRARVLLAANLASVIAEIHAVGHYMIDMKPLNMRFYRLTSYMALIDTDGFSINGPARIPARHCSDDYTAPEAHGKIAAVLGLEQDLFALAVIIFQLLNNGIHPHASPHFF